jgi:hypothetical protein
MVALDGKLSNRYLSLNTLKEKVKQTNAITISI